VPLSNWSKLKFLNQVRQTYLVCQAEDGICIIDQHAAAERVVFSKLRKQYQAKDIAAQALLFPATVEMHPDEMETFVRYSAEVEKMGLDVQQRGPATLSVHAVPRLLQKASPERILRDLLAEFGRTGNRAFSGAVDKMLATMACHAAIRAGDLVHPGEAQALLEGLDGADFAGYCPHGRPIVAFLSWAELERKVGRR
jgi:DNA mismatch repair protein MutL